MFTNRKKRWSSGSGGGKRAIGNRMGRQFDKGHGDTYTTGIAPYNSEGARGRDRPAHQTCHSTKRTHRFAVGFAMQWTLHEEFTAKNCGEYRWVRFGKRTHRQGVIRW